MEYTTNWSVVLAMNSIVYLLLGLSVVCSLVGSVAVPFLCFGCCGSICGNIAMFASIIVTGVFRYREWGAACAMSKTQVVPGVTFEMHGEEIQGLFISQCVFYIFLICCNSFIMTFSGQLGGAQCAMMFKN